MGWVRKARHLGLPVGVLNKASAHTKALPRRQQQRLLHAGATWFLVTLQKEKDQRSMSLQETE